MPSISQLTAFEKVYFSLENWSDDSISFPGFSKTSVNPAQRNGFIMQKPLSSVEC